MNEINPCHWVIRINASSPPVQDRGRLFTKGRGSKLYLAEPTKIKKVRTVHGDLTGESDGNITGVIIVYKIIERTPATPFSLTTAPATGRPPRWTVGKGYLTFSAATWQHERFGVHY